MRWWLVSGVSAVLLVSACSGGADPTTTTAGVAPTSPPTTAPPTTTEPTTTTTAAAAGGAECLVGVWELDSQTFVDSIFEVFGADMPEVVGSFEYVSGTYIVELAADGSFSNTREEWSFEVATSEGALRTTIDGVDSGRYSVEGNTISITDVEQTTVVSLQIEVGGEFVDLPFAAPVEIDTDILLGSAMFVCDGDQLTVTAEEGVTASFTRIS